jgi:hypothetical protein
VNLQLNVLSQNDLLLRLVGDFARGLGCAVHENEASSELRIESSAADDEVMLELLGFVALSATRTGVDLAEPLCRVTYWRGDATAQTSLDLRIADFRLTATRSANGSDSNATP